MFVSGYTRKCPYYYMDKRRREGQSCVPTFEYDGLRPRFRTLMKPWTLPCNLFVISNFTICQEDMNMKIWNWRIICLFRYDVRHPKSLETYLEKVTGKKGPYNLFTGYSRSVLRVSNILHQSICFQGQGMKARSRAILQLWNWRIMETGPDRCQQKWTNCCINRIILRDVGPPVQGIIIKIYIYAMWGIYSAKILRGERELNFYSPEMNILIFIIIKK